MKYDYLIMVLVGFTLFSLCFRLWRNGPWKRVALTIAGLLLLTALFDQVIIRTGAVAYDETQILGLKLGVAPVEDFMYAIVAGLLMPALWERIERTNKK